MTPPTYHPTLPYLGEIPGGFVLGKQVRIQGRIPFGASSFSISFQFGKDSEKDDVGLLMFSSFTDNLLIRKSRINSKWGKEQSQGQFPFTRGLPFTILISSEHKQFTINVNGRSFASFTQKGYTPDKISHFFIQGEVMVAFIQWTQEEVPDPPNTTTDSSPEPSQPAEINPGSNHNATNSSKPPAPNSHAPAFKLLLPNTSQPPPTIYHSSSYQSISSNHQQVTSSYQSSSYKPLNSGHQHQNSGHQNSVSSHTSQVSGYQEPTSNFQSTTYNHQHAPRLLLNPRYPSEQCGGGGNNKFYRPTQTDSIPIPFPFPTVAARPTGNPRPLNYPNANQRFPFGRGGNKNWSAPGAPRNRLPKNFAPPPSVLTPRSIAGHGPPVRNHWAGSKSHRTSEPTNYNAGKSGTDQMAPTKDEPCNTSLNETGRDYGSNNDSRSVAQEEKSQNSDAGIPHVYIPKKFRETSPPKPGVPTPRSDPPPNSMPFGNAQQPDDRLNNDKSGNADGGAMDADTSTNCDGVEEVQCETTKSNGEILTSESYVAPPEPCVTAPYVAPPVPYVAPPGPHVTPTGSRSNNNSNQLDKLVRPKLERHDSHNNITNAPPPLHKDTTDEGDSDDVEILAASVPNPSHSYDTEVTSTGATDPEDVRDNRDFRKSVKRSRESSSNSPSENDLLVIVTYADNQQESISQDGFNVFCAAIDHMICRSITGPTKAAYRITESSLVEMGRIQVTCVDGATVVWIIKVCSSISWNSPTGTKQFKGWKYDEAPEIPKVLYKTFKVWVPGIRANISEFFEVLQGLNDGLKTECWRCYDSFATKLSPNSANGFSFILGIDLNSVEFLKNNQFKLFYGANPLLFSEVTTRRARKSS